VNRRSNPFATRYIVPGAIPFVFSPDVSADLLINRLAEIEWWGQIVGPHGSGKSSLLTVLLPKCREAGREVVAVTLRDRQRRLPLSLDMLSASGRDRNSSLLVVVDGYEQLGGWSRFRLKRWCRARHAGLLITSHKDCGLPTLYRTSTDLELFRKLVDTRMRAACMDGQLDANVIEKTFWDHQGNVREAFLSLFDVVRETHRA
jgi:hypothetical protein